MTQNCKRFTSECNYKSSAQLRTTFVVVLRGLFVLTEFNNREVLESLSVLEKER
jgi:hypothetical protein